MDRAIGRNAALDHLFRAHNGWLNGWVRRKSRSVSAEDVSSEVFLRLLTLASIEELRQPRAMMATIASRVIYDLRRRAALWQAFEEVLLSSSLVTEASPEERLVVTEALRNIDAILSTMSPKAKAAFLYSRIDGMSYGEIADILGVSVRTVERYLAEGMRKALTVMLDER